MNNNTLLSLITAFGIISVVCLNKSNSSDETVRMELSFSISINWKSNETYTILFPTPISSHYEPNVRSMKEGQPVEPLNESKFVEGNGTFNIETYDSSFVINVTSNESVTINYEEEDPEKLFGKYFTFSKLSNQHSGTNYLLYYNSSSDSNITVSYYAYHSSSWGFMYSLDNATLKKGWNQIEFNQELYYYGD